MRRRLTILSLATTGLVVIALVVPLALLVREQARDRAISAAETTAQSTASLVALVMAVADDPAQVTGPALDDALGSLEPGTVVVLDDGFVVGEPIASQPNLVERARSLGATVSGAVGSAWEVALPVVGREGTTVVDVYVPEVELQRGVGSAWLLLGLLAVVLVVAAVLLADRLGRRLVEPVAELARSANRMAEGDLSVRLPPLQPDEVGEVGEAFNYLAARLGGLLTAERESVADLSHRLRTPLTSLRLQAEALTDAGEREQLMSQVDRLEKAVSQLIETARNPAADEPGACRLDEVVTKRVMFWSVLADSQRRDFADDLRSGDAVVAIGPEAVETMVDLLLENVFTHTPAGTPLDVSTFVESSEAVIEVADRGPGFGAEQVERGVGSGASTGLGLDIARRLAESAGGGLSTDDRQGGGAIVRARLPLSV